MIDIRRVRLVPYEERLCCEECGMEAYSTGGVFSSCGITKYQHQCAKKHTTYVETYKYPRTVFEEEQTHEHAPKV